MSSFDEKLDAVVERPVDMKAAEFVEQRDSVSWTEADENRFTAWLDEAPAHRVAFMRLNASWKRTERLVALRTADFKRPVTNVPSSNRWPLKIAMACGLVLASAVGLTTYFSAPHYDTYATTIGGHETLSLHDGSKIELNTDTVVHVSQTQKRRLVVLEKGEAYFQVHHDEARPFVVVAGTGRILDLGTKFAVQSEQGHLKVSLVEGRVKVELKDAPEKETTLSSGDVLLASAGSVSVKRAPVADLSNALAWRKGMLIFHGTTLLDAAREFNRYNETKIAIDDPRAARETINGALLANDLGEFERMAGNLFGLKAKKRANEIVFSR